MTSSRNDCRVFSSLFESANLLTWGLEDQKVKIMKTNINRINFSKKISNNISSLNDYNDQLLVNQNDKTIILKEGKLVIQKDLHLPKNYNFILKSGDEMNLSIDNLGGQKSKVISL